MKVAFRVDASLEIGSGHVMRCLTLADSLRNAGAQCHFISRKHSGHMLELVRQHGHLVTALLTGDTFFETNASMEKIPIHETWLGCDWSIDAKQTAGILAEWRPDLLIVDHYAIDQRWEDAVAPYYEKLLVIDDLADRFHNCDLLLDQNLGRQIEDYAEIVPDCCQVLAGPNYALLRPEFLAMRGYSLARRQSRPVFRELLVTMGGVDKLNATSQVLLSLKNCNLPKNCRITVVMGLNAPWISSVQQLAIAMPWQTDVVVNVSDMAQLMANSDLNIGAAGSTSWERCCLGLPALVVILADNQTAVARHLEDSGAVSCFKLSDLLSQKMHNSLLEVIQLPERLSAMTHRCSVIVDGLGVTRVLAAIAKVIN